MAITLDAQLRRRPVDPAELERLKDEMRSYARAWHLREVRKAQDMTQVDVAEELGIGQNRVSQIERGDIDRTQVSTLRRYVEALGGHLNVEAEFGDTRYVIAG